jgi:hypothetical protein
MPKKDQTIIQLQALKKRTRWSWERMCRQMHRIMDEEGPSHTTLYRYAAGRVKRRNKLTERWIMAAMKKLRDEVS